MTASMIVALLVGAVLAFANGSNDVSKSIATLVGSGVCEVRPAIAWGALWTGVGGVAGALFARAMLATFGAGLLAPGVHPTIAAALAALAGAAAFVLVATRTGLPVSTTHAIVGALLGVAMVAYGAGGVRWSALGSGIVLPLLASPVAALVLTDALLLLTRRRADAPAAAEVDCVCATVVASPPAIASASGAAFVVAQPPRLEIVTGPAAECARTQPAALRVTRDRLHFLTSGATALARAMNDGPKMVALVLAVAALGGTASLIGPAFALVTLGMVAGSLVAGLRVTRLLAKKVTPMDQREGFTANLVTAALVATGAVFGLPMSTTHVASGGIFGAGALRGSLDRKVLRDILLAWLVTVPASALLGAAMFLAVVHVGR